MYSTVISPSVAGSNSAVVSVCSVAPVQTPVPPAGETVAVIVTGSSPSQNGPTLGNMAVGDSLTVIVAEPVAVQPLPSVAVTLRSNVPSSVPVKSGVSLFRSSK